MKRTPNKVKAIRRTKSLVGKLRKKLKTGKRFRALEAAALKSMVVVARMSNREEKARIARLARDNPFWADAYPTTNGLQPYRFSFMSGGKRHWWIRYGKGLESTFDLAKKAAKREYNDASGFSIESPQRENPSKKSVKSRKSIRARYAHAHKLLDADYEKWSAQGHMGLDGKWVNTKRAKGRGYGNKTLWAKTTKLATMQARTRPRSHNILAGKRRAKK